MKTKSFSVSGLYGLQRKEERGYHHARTDPSDRLAYQYASPFVVWLYSPNA